MSRSILAACILLAAMLAMPATTFAATPVAPVHAPPTALAPLARLATGPASAVHDGPAATLRALADLAESKAAFEHKLAGLDGATHHGAQLRADADVLTAALDLQRAPDAASVQRVLVLAGADPSAAARLPTFERHATLLDAFDAWLDAHHQPATDATNAARADLASVSEPASSSLARIFDAQSYQQRALEAAQGDVAMLEQARALVAGETLGALPGLGAHATLAGSPIEICGLLQLDLIGIDNSWSCDAILNVDVGGFDEYTNNAGGAGGAAPATALAIHLGGNAVFDTYFGRTGGITGGASGNALGFLLTTGGNDAIQSIIDMQGSAIGGADAGGVGLFVTASGGNLLIARGAGGLLGGGVGDGSGAALMLGTTGSTVTTSGPSYCYFSCSVGPLAVAGPGSGVGGRGLLVTLASSESYTFEDSSQPGFLAAHGSAIDGGSGLMLALGGGLKSYRSASMDTASLGAFDGAAIGGVGVLVNLGAANQYWTNLSYVGGVAEGAAAGLVPSTSVLGVTSLEARERGGVGFLWAGDGADLHMVNGTGMATGDFYGIGMLVDGAGALAPLDEFDSFPSCTEIEACTENLAQAAGRDLGVGILVDASDGPLLNLNGDGTSAAFPGQATGEGGVGLMTIESKDPIIFWASGAALPGDIDGSGVATRQLATFAYLNGVRPFLGCQSPAIQEDSSGSFCTPDSLTARAIRDPRTGDPLSPVPGPSTTMCDVPGDPCDVICSVPPGLCAIDLQPVPVVGAVNEITAESSYAATLSGGAYTMTVTDVPNLALHRDIVSSVDDFCENSCQTLFPQNVL